MAALMFAGSICKHNFDNKIIVAGVKVIFFICFVWKFPFEQHNDCNTQQIFGFKLWKTNKLKRNAHVKRPL